MNGGPSRSPAAAAALRFSRVRVVRAHRGEDGAAWARAIEDGGWLAESRVLKEDGATWVRRARVMGREVVVKCRGIDGAWARVKCALVRGKGDRHWRGAALLAGKSVPTARVMVLARARVDGRESELLVMEWVEGPTLLRVMADVHAGGAGALGVRGQHELAREVGRQVFALGELFNRDHKPSNLIVMSKPEGGARIAVIDCEGVRRATIPGAARMFASLVIEPTGCGVRPRRALMMRAVRGWIQGAEAADESIGAEGPVDREERRAMVRMMWGDVARVVAHHGDPTPRVDPLAR